MNLFDVIIGGSSDEVDDKPCNVSGHDWSEWEDDSFGARTKSVSLKSLFGQTDKLKVYTNENRECEKCGKFDSRRRTIGYIKVDADEDEIEVTG